MSNPQISDLFNDFAGKEVEMLERKYEYRGKNYTEYTIKKGDETITAMQDLAKENDVTLRMWAPGSVGTMDFRMNRVNGGVEQGTDGKWRVGSSFTIG